MTNHLAKETSPYLRQHQDNPVDWYPWGEEALRRAKEENKPIFLSIGYAACHWCHVMAHESFENPQTAEILNENFISIKVDREERPDLDDIYMQAVVMLTGRGGWPMSVFLTPSLKPFYGGTYFPPAPRYGMPSFNQVLISVRDAWDNRQDELINHAEVITDSIQSQTTQMDSTSSERPDLNGVVDQLFDTYDWDKGGWGPAPKFPQPMVIEFLIQRALLGNRRATYLVEDLLTQMALGGLFDLVEGGFHRYSTDANWLVPHFEKMLYDNAQLALAYLHGFALTGNIFFKWVAVKTLNFIQAALTHPEGGFYASLDADTAEGEGRYYTYQVGALRTQLPEDQFNQLRTFIHLREQGNFEEGLNILQFKNTPQALAEENHLSLTALLDELDPLLATLRDLRKGRLSPGRDEKIITGWNALAIRAFAEAGSLLNRADYLDIARNAANFILENLQPSPGRLLRSWSQEKAAQPGTLEDYAGMILGLNTLYQADFSPELYQAMHKFQEGLEEEFSSDETYYYDAAASVSNLIVRPRNLQDNAIPSGNALAAHVHWLFANLNDAASHFSRMTRQIASVSNQMRDYPTHFGYWLQVADLAQQPTQQIALVTAGGKETLQPFLRIYRQHYRPHSLIAAKFANQGEGRVVPDLLNDRFPIDEKATAYVCRNFTCLSPTTSPEIFEEQLNAGDHFTDLPEGDFRD